MAIPSKSVGNELIDSVTLTVSPIGNDNDTTRPRRIVRGDWSLKPFATIQAAINALPKTGSLSRSLTFDDVTINVAAGTYPGFVVMGSSLRIAIKGVRKNFTPTTGPQNGTATSGTTSTITLTGAGWTIDDLEGKYLNIIAGSGAGQIIPIAYNTSDTITVAGVGTTSFGSGSVFSIEEPNVLINSVPSGFSYPITISFNSGMIRLYDLKISAGTHGIIAQYSNYVWVYRCVVIAPLTGIIYSNIIQGISRGYVVDSEGGSSDGIVAQIVMYTSFSQCLCINSLSSGISAFLGVVWVNTPFGFVVKGCQYGFYVEGTSQRCYVDYALIDDCQYGVYIAGSNIRLRHAEIKNSTAQAFVLSQAQLQLAGRLSGINNVGFGLNAKGPDNYIILDGFTPTITGSSGDATVDGTTALTWSTDFVSSDNYKVDTASGARIYRS